MQGNCIIAIRKALLPNAIVEQSKVSIDLIASLYFPRISSQGPVKVNEIAFPLRPVT